MKKILFVSSRNPYSGRYSGDVIRSLKVINFLKKNYLVDIVYLGSENQENSKNILVFKNPNLILKIFNCLYSIVKLKPIQFGLFFSKEMKNYILNNFENYDGIFFYHIRSSQYLPKNFRGFTLLEMGDLYSENYHLMYKYLSPLNPLKYVYLIESFLVKKIEKSIFKNFDKIILFSKKEIQRVDVMFRKKTIHINESIQKISKSYSYSKKNSTVLFVGNLHYLPNVLACKNFIKQTLPKLVKIIPDIKFCIIGSISKTNKFLFEKNKSVQVLDQQKNIEKYAKKAFCGLANLEVATGVQGKVLTYMACGLPAICSKKVADNFDKKVLTYKNESEFINCFKILKYNKKKSEKISKEALKYIKKFQWDSISKKYLKIF